MAKTSVADWDTTAADNTDINSISLAENVMKPPAVNNAFRETMAQIAQWTGEGTIASAATCDIGAENQEFLNVTGTTTITSFGTARAGTKRVLLFAGALTLTHDDTSLILPGEDDITTAAGDVAVMVSEGSGNWRCVGYQISGGGPYGAVRGDIDQTGKDDAWKEQARDNINAGLVMSATVGTTSGSAIDFTSIPEGVKRIEIRLFNVSTSDTNNLRVQIGTSGGFETTSYASCAGLVAGSTAVASATDAFLLMPSNTAALRWSGTVTLALVDETNNLWSFNATLGRISTDGVVVAGGHRSLSAALDRVRLTFSGAGSFDSGSVVVVWEF